jgi:hypothetical protein
VQRRLIQWGERENPNSDGEWNERMNKRERERQEKKGKKERMKRTKRREREWTKDCCCVMWVGLCWWQPVSSCVVRTFRFVDITTCFGLYLPTCHSYHGVSFFSFSPRNVPPGPNSIKIRLMLNGAPAMVKDTKIEIKTKVFNRKYSFSTLHCIECTIPRIFYHFCILNHCPGGPIKHFP